MAVTIKVSEGKGVKPFGFSPVLVTFGSPPQANRALTRLQDSIEGLTHLEGLCLLENRGLREDG